MKSKKIIFIALLIVFIVCIGIIVLKVNDKSIAKNNELTNSQNTTENTTQVASDSTNSSLSIRKSTGNADADLNNMIEIKDNFFIEQTNDVYINLDEYVGKTIKMQGLVYSYEGAGDKLCYAVVRNTPGCCGNDGLAGLDIAYNKEYPEEDTWVEVVGVVTKEKSYGGYIPVLQVFSITETEEGITFVTN